MNPDPSFMQPGPPSLACPETLGAPATSGAPLVALPGPPLARITMPHNEKRAPDLTKEILAGALGFAKRWRERRRQPVAEDAGFEPARGFIPNTISNRAH